MNDISNEIPLMSKNVFQEDVVRLSTNREKVGLVLSALDSEEESDSEDEERISEGHVLVSWYPKGQEEEVEEKKLEVVDRSLLPGDVVRWADQSKGAMKGFISRVNVAVSIKIMGSSYVLKNVNCCDLKPLQEYFPGLTVVLDSWIGVVDEVFVKLTLKLKNGARCAIEGEQVNMLTDVTDQRDEESPYHCEMFYPGQCVAATSRSFKDVQWINGPRPVFTSSQRINCVVEKVEIQSLRVDWQMQGFTGKATDATLLSPDPVIYSDTINSNIRHDSDYISKTTRRSTAYPNIRTIPIHGFPNVYSGLRDSTRPKLVCARLMCLNNFKDASIQLGDKAFYVLKEKDVSTSNVFGAEAASGASASDSKASASRTLTAGEKTWLTISHPKSVLSPSSGVSIDGTPLVARDEASLVATREDASRRSVKMGESGSLAVEHASIAARNKEASEQASVKQAAATPSNEQAALSSGIASSSSEPLSTAAATAATTISESKVPSSAGCKTVTRKSMQNYEEARETTSSDDSADDEDSDQEVQKDSRSNVPANPPMRCQDSRHQAPTLTSRGHAARRRRHYTRKKKKHQVPVRLVAGEPVVVEITSTKTAVTVTWQDNQQEENVCSTDLLPVLHVDDLEFFPGDFVIDKSNSSAENGYGVVQKVDGPQRTCQIRWQKDEAPDPDNFYSVYDIGDHPDFIFRPGDVVVRLTGPEAGEVEKADTLCEVSPCGQVTRVDSNGKVNIIWTDKTVSAIAPENLYVLHTEDGDDWSTSSNDHSNSDGEWETTSEVSSNEEPYHMNPLEDVIMRSLSAMGENYYSGSRDQEEEQEASPVPQTLPDEETPKDKDTRLRSEGDCQATNHRESFSMVAHVPESHRFYSTSHEPINPRHFNSTIRKEIIGLKSHLPPGVFVKGYENRMDLFSILVYGPADTPYEDGLFLFDLLLPADYPKSPPTLHYVSQCTGRLNPNLYEDGTVCVSLLGTWNGKGTETWTSKSNICQLIISIQGLILCERPYFNEAGYEKHRGSAEGTENSRVYNEMVLIKLLQSVENIIKNPSETFLQEIEEYRRMQLPRLLNRIETWLMSFGTSKFLDENFPDKSSFDKIPSEPGFPLLPFSYGFCLTLNRALKSLSNTTNDKPV